MMLMVWPVAHNRMTALNKANGIFMMTMMALRQSSKNKRTITPVKTAPSVASNRRPRKEFLTYGD